MKKVIFYLFVIFFVNNVLLAKELTIKMAASPITIDGSGDEEAWKITEFQDIDQLALYGNPQKNNTARFKMTYDKKFVYVYAEVTDLNLDTSSTKYYEKDCIEVFFCFDTSSTKTLYSGTNAFYNLRKLFGGEFIDPYNKGFISKEKKTDNGITQEWRLSWDSIASTIKDKNRWSHNRFKFDILNIDCDSSVFKSRLYWNSNKDDQWASQVHQGYVITQYFLDIKEPKLKLPSIKIENNYIRFEGKTDYKVVNVTGAIVMQGSHSYGFSIANLKKGLYIVQSDNETLKFVK